MKNKLLLSLFLIISLLAVYNDALAIKPEVVRDEYGNPRITAPTNEKLFELFGYTLAEDRLWQLELNKRWSRGTLAEIFGPKTLPSPFGNAISTDQQRRLLGYTEEEYLSIFDSMPRENKKITKAFINGINRRIDEVMANPGELLPYEFKKLGITPSHWSVPDSLAMTSAVYRRFGTVGGSELSNLNVLQKLLSKYDAETAWKMFNDFYWINDPDSPTYIEKEGEDNVRHKKHKKFKKFSDAGEAAKYAKRFSGVSQAFDGYLRLEEACGKFTTGLNAPPIMSATASFLWTMLPERTVKGYPMISSNPQMGYEFPTCVYEVYLKGGNGFDVVGYSTPGRPSVSIGHNKNVAWCQNTGMADVVDIYAETLNPDNHEQYQYKGKWMDMEKRTEIFQVAGGSPISVTIYRTIHGPVIAPFPFDPGNPAVTQVYTWKYSHWLKEPTNEVGFLDLNRAKNVHEAVEAVRQIYSSHHFGLADTSGNIGYIQAGWDPIRPEGTDSRLPLLGTGEAEWTGEFRENSWAVNPSNGYIAGWNNKSSPQYNNPDGSRFGKFHRAWWIKRWVEDNSVFTPEDMEDILLRMGSVGVGGTNAGGFIKEILPIISKAIKAVPPSDPYYGSLNQALSLLSTWEGLGMEDARTSTTIKVEQTIFHNWLTLVIKNTFQDEFEGIRSFTSYSDDGFNVLLHAWDGIFSPLPVSRNYFDDITTSDVIETSDGIVVKSMKETIDKLTTQFGTSDMSQWKAPRPNTDIVHPILGKVGSFPTQNSGTYSFITELKPKGAEGISRYPFGSSGFIAMDAAGNPVFSPHVFSMMPLYINFEYQPMLIENKPKCK